MTYQAWANVEPQGLSQCGWLTPSYSGTHEFGDGICDTNATYICKKQSEYLQALSGHLNHVTVSLGR